MSGEKEKEQEEDNGGVKDPGRRELLKKAVYTAPAIVCIGVLYPASVGGAQSCENSPLGCPPDPPGQIFPMGNPDTFPFDPNEER